MYLLLFVLCLIFVIIFITVPAFMFFQFGVSFFILSLFLLCLLLLYIVSLLFQCFFYSSVLAVFLGYFTEYSWNHVIRTPITRKIRRNSLVPSEFTSKPLYKSSYNLNSHNSKNHLNGTEYLEDIRLFEFSNSNDFNPLFLNLIFFKINTWKKVASVFCSEWSQKESIAKWF